MCKKLRKIYINFILRFFTDLIEKIGKYNLIINIYE